METFDARLKVPFGLICAGPPLSGKTQFALDLLKHSKRLVNRPFDYIVWFYGERNETVDALEGYQGIKTVQGLPPDIDQYIEDVGYGCHVYDDLQETASNSSQLANLTSAKCQHRKISWILIMQNLFHRGRERVGVLRCAHYVVLYKNPLDKTTARYVGDKFMPKNQQVFLAIYEAATSAPNGYLFIDGAQQTPDKARLRTDIFHPDHQRVFVPTNKR